MNPKEINKVLIIQTAFIGDVILATPVIEALFTFNNSINIDFLVRKGNESLLVGNPHIRNTLIWEKKNNKYKNLFGLISKVRKQKYDLVVNLHRFGSSGFITALSGAKFTLGFDKNPFSSFFSFRVEHLIGGENQMHEVERNLSLLQKIGIPTQNAKMKLFPSDEDFNFVKQYIQDTYIVIAPASVWFTKQFPIQKWKEFVKEIPKTIKVIMIGAKSDYDLSQQILVETSSNNYLNLCGKLSFLQSAALMKNAKMCFVNDSAPLHIASSMNAPTTAIFCSTITDFGFGPLSDRSVVIEVGEKLDCRPCGLHGKKSCPKAHFDCANKIEIQKLIEIIVEKE